MASVWRLFAAPRPPFNLVVDNAEVLTNPASRDVLCEAARRLPTSCRLVVASRSWTPLPTPRLRTTDQVLEIGPSDLAMEEVEAWQVLEAAGVSVDTDTLTHLLASTEGWPVALYLSALALRRHGRPPHELAAHGDHRLIADYLRAEVLDHLPGTTVAFLQQTAVLDRFCAPLCDAVTKGTRSAELLDELVRTNILLVPLDDSGRWYRYHHLFRDLLMADLERRHEPLVRLLHARAARWYDAHDLRTDAIPHAQAANDAQLAARLVMQTVGPAFAAGRSHTVRRWTDWFRAAPVDRFPQVAAVAALNEAFLGEAAAAEEWADRAQAAANAVPDTGQSLLYLARAVLGRGGLEQMRDDADAAAGDPGLRAITRAGPLLFGGLSRMMSGATDEADRMLAEAAAAAQSSPPTAVAALAMRAALALDRRDWTSARQLTADALARLDAASIDGYLSGLPAHAVAARLAARDHDRARGRRSLGHAARLRPLCTQAVPASTLFLLQLARAHVELGDPAGAIAVLNQIDDIATFRRELGTVPDQVRTLRSQLGALDRSRLGAGALTAAELRLVPYLPTYLSYGEIAQRLHVSRNTVKSQASSIYRKIGATSRGQAVELLAGAGLLAS